MAVFVIPTFTDPFYTMTVALEGRDYVFEFRYNQREDVWYFSIGLPDGTTIAAGLKVVCRREFLHRIADVRLPRGTLLAVSNELPLDESPPGLEELGEGRRVQLIYATSDETFEGVEAG